RGADRAGDRVHAPAAGLSLRPTAPVPLRRGGRRRLCPAAAGSGAPVDARPGPAGASGMALRMKRLLMGSAAELRYEPYPLRVRATVDGLTAVESTRAALVREPRRLVPVCAVPAEDLHGTLVETRTPAADEHEFPPFLGPDDFALHTTEGRAFDVVVGERTLEGAAFAPDNPALDGRVELDFAAFERWYVEDEELVGHARDP